MVGYLHRPLVTPITFTLAAEVKVNQATVLVEMDATCLRNVREISIFTIPQDIAAFDPSASDTDFGKYRVILWVQARQIA